MKKFIENKKFITIVIAVILSVILTSCAEEKDESLDEDLFFGIVYKAVGTRERSGLEWRSTEGTYQMKVLQTTEDSGTFIFYFNQFVEHPKPTLQNYCTGGVEGNFEKASSEIFEDDCEEDYNVMDCRHSELPDNNYDTNEPGETEEVDRVHSFSFLMMPIRSTLNTGEIQGCDFGISEGNVRILRFTNGELIFRIGPRELKMVPVLSSESQIQ